MIQIMENGVQRGTVGLRKCSERSKDHYSDTAAGWSVRSGKLHKLDGFSARVIRSLPMQLGHGSYVSTQGPQVSIFTMP